MPLLSVIIPTYNRSQLLAEALESVQGQEFTDYEVIVVDDGSTDNTPSLLRQFAQDKMPGKLRVLRQANAGQGAARNLAIGEAHGDYCMFLDSDDRFFPWTLATIARAINDNDRPSVLLGQEHDFTNNEDFAAIKPTPFQARAWPDLYTYAAQDRLGPCGILVARTEALREVGGFLTERMVGEDADLMLRLGIAPKMVKIKAPPMYGYRLHAENFTLTQDVWYRGACAFMRRYRNGSFPGGPARAAEVRRHAAVAVACYSTACLFYGGRLNCLKVYLQTVGWQWRAGLHRYVFETPVRIALSMIGLWPKKQLQHAIQRWGQ
jgi:glycosyltransferase involved in cell wall biosynthesis